MFHHLFDVYVVEPFRKGRAYHFGCLTELIPMFGAATYTLLWLVGVYLLWKQRKDKQSADEEFSKH